MNVTTVVEKSRTRPRCFKLNGRTKGCGGRKRIHHRAHIDTTTVSTLLPPTLGGVGCLCGGGVGWGFSAVLKLYSKSASCTSSHYAVMYPVLLLMSR